MENVCTLIVLEFYYKIIKYEIIKDRLANMTKIDDLRYKAIFGEMKLESQVIDEGKLEADKCLKRIKKHLNITSCK